MFNTNHAHCRAFINWVRTLSKALEDYLRNTHEELQRTGDEFRQEQQTIGKRLRDVDDNVETLCTQAKQRKLREEALSTGTVSIAILIEPVVNRM